MDDTEAFEELKERGLTAEEAKLFFELLKKISPTKEDIKDYNDEMNVGVGGISFTEALTYIKFWLE